MNLIYKEKPEEDVALALTRLQDMRNMFASLKPTVLTMMYLAYIDHIQQVIGWLHQFAPKEVPQKPERIIDWDDGSDEIGRGTVL